MKISIVGCGTIGTGIVEWISKHAGERLVEIVALVDVVPDRASKLASTIKPAPKVTTLDEAVELADVVVECADRKVVPELARKAIIKGKDIMIMSIGGLVEHLDLLDLAREKNRCIYLPSGALAGIDGVKSAAVGRIDSITLTTRKPPNGLKGAPYFKAHPINLDKIADPTIVFEGTAREAIKGFPANINVSICLSLGGVGLDRTRVRIIADPTTNRNIHEVTVEGESGRIFTRTENVPSPMNPKTSYLAVLSAIATFKRIIDPVKIGT